MSFLLEGILRWNEGNISSRIVTKQTGFEWPSITICPVIYDDFNGTDCTDGIIHNCNKTFVETREIISMKDRIDVKLWTDWCYNSEPK